MAEKLSVCQIKFKLIPESTTGELSDEVLRKCHFCEKTCEITAVQSPIMNRLSGQGNFYCSFCLRHGLNTRGNRDVLVLSFRSIIGYFYVMNYVQNQPPKKLWLAEIEDYIESHTKAGTINPLFLYDPETMLWFVNFSRVGTSKKKIPLEEIHKTIVSILASFNLSEMVPGISIPALFAKYRDAVDGFYRKRFRPENRRLLIPTLANTGASESKLCGFEKMRHFTFEDLQAKK